MMDTFDFHEYKEYDDSQQAKGYIQLFQLPHAYYKN